MLFRSSSLAGWALKRLRVASFHAAKDSHSLCTLQASWERSQERAPHCEGRETETVGLRPGSGTGPGLIPGSSSGCLLVIRMSPRCDTAGSELTSPCFVISQMQESLSLHEWAAGHGSPAIWTPGSLVWAQPIRAPGLGFPISKMRVTATSWARVVVR